MSLKEKWMEEFKTFLIKLDKKEFGSLRLLKILEDNGGLEFSPTNTIRLNLKILGFKISLTYKPTLNRLAFNFEDTIGRIEDLDHLLFLYVRLLNQRMLGFILNTEENFVNVSMLHGGMAGKAYQKKAIDFIVSEMFDLDNETVEKICDDLGISPVQHLTSDWALESRIINGFRIRIAYWSGEEGIPPNAIILYGAEILKTGLPIEDVNTLTEIFVNRLVACYRKITGRKPRRWESLYS